GQTAASNPPSNSGTLPPMLTGITPEIGPPFAAAAGVSSSRLAPALSGAGVHRNGVMPCTCAEAPGAGTSTRAATLSSVPATTRRSTGVPPDERHESDPGSTGPRPEGIHRPHRLIDAGVCENRLTWCRIGAEVFV